MRRILQVLLLSAALLPAQTTLGPSGGHHSGSRQAVFTDGSADAPVATPASEPFPSVARPSETTHGGGGSPGGTPRPGRLFSVRLGPDPVVNRLRRHLDFRRMLARAHMGLACWPATAPPPLHLA